MKKRTKRIIGIICGALLFLFIAGLWAGVLYAYKENFCQRFISYEPKLLYLSDYENLTRTQYQFESNKGQKLTGYMYSSNAAGAEIKKGIVVLAHGFGGGGHNSYMDCINVFAEHGYYVFAYDATGNDESQGLGKENGVGGLPQGVIDLDYAISFIEKNGNFPKLPIVLFGHSWGGFCVSSVPYYHPEVKAVAECSGFCESAGMFEAQGKTMVGPVINLMLPFLRLHEFFKFKKYALANGVKGLSATDARVMIIHSKDDTTVPPDYGYSIYYKKFKDNPRFNFLLYEDKGHSAILISQEGVNYRKSYNEEFDRYFSSLDYDYKASENKERFSKEKAEYLHKHIDRKIYCHTPNEELLLQIIAMYDEVLAK